MYISINALSANRGLAYFLWSSFLVVTFRLFTEPLPLPPPPRPHQASCCPGRVSSKQKQTKFLVRTKTNRNKICFGCVSVCFMKPETKIRCVSVCFSVLNLYQNNGNKKNCFEINRNNPKFSEKYQNMLSIKLFQFVFCLFRFNQSTETLCFGIEAKQTVSKGRCFAVSPPQLCSSVTSYLTLASSAVGPSPYTMPG